MSIATKLMAEAAEAQAHREREEQARLDTEEAKRTEHQLAIFDRARTTFDLCLTAARTAAAGGAKNAAFQLAPGRFERSDYRGSLNQWQMAVLALRENGLKADLYWGESEDHDELGGRGRCTVQTPFVNMFWDGGPPEEPSEP